MNCAFIKNHSRKILSSAAVLVLLASMLSACQKENGTPDESTPDTPGLLVEDKTDPTGTDPTESNIIMEEDMATVKEQVNVRSSPSTGATVIAQLEKGDQVKVIRQDTSFGIAWAYTKLGWVPMSALEMNMPQNSAEEPDATSPQEETTPAATDPKEEDIPNANIKGVITANELNIRREASTDSDIVGGYKKGDVVSILEIKNGWGRTSEGWISMQHVKTSTDTDIDNTNTGNTDNTNNNNNDNSATASAAKGVVVVNELNIRSEASQNSDRVGAYTYGDRVSILETKNGWGRTDKGWISLNYVYLDGSTGSNPCKGVVIGTQLNVRSGPGTNYDKVSSLNYGDRVQVLERIKVGNATWGCTKSGWISMDYIYVDGTTGDGSGSGTVTGNQLNIRSGPGTNYDSVGTLNSGDTVEILTQIKIGDVTWGCISKGWISMAYVNMD